MPQGAVRDGGPGRALWRRVLAEPMLHFLVIGAALFTFYGAVARPVDSPVAGEIVVTAATVDNLAAQFEAVWRRPPTGPELTALIEDHVEEEIYYREALALGLDRDDTVIRRRLRQKMEFLGETGAAGADPPEDVLRVHYQDTAERYTTQPRVAFQQVFFGQDEAAAGMGLAALGGGVAPQTIGVPTLLPASMPMSPSIAVDGTFGDGFFETLAGLEPDRWAGPVESSFGYHLVRVEAVEPGRLLPFNEVRHAVLTDWQQAEAEAMRLRQFEQMRARYRIVLPGSPE